MVVPGVRLIVCTDGFVNQRSGSEHVHTMDTFYLHTPAYMKVAPSTHIYLVIHGGSNTSGGTELYVHARVNVFQAHALIQVHGSSNALLFPVFLNRT